MKLEAIRWARFFLCLYFLLVEPKKNHLSDDTFEPGDATFTAYAFASSSVISTGTARFMLASH